MATTTPTTRLIAAHQEHAATNAVIQDLHAAADQALGDGHETELCIHAADRYQSARERWLGEHGLDEAWANRIEAEERLIRAAHAHAHATHTGILYDHTGAEMERILRGGAITLARRKIWLSWSKTAVAIAESRASRSVE